jgi:hypothetical protein
MSKEKILVGIFDFEATRRYESRTKEHFDSIESCSGNLKIDGR